MSRLLAPALAALLLAGPTTALAADEAPLAPVVFLERARPVDPKAPEALPVFRALAPGEARTNAERWVRNEAADFIRRVIAEAAVAIPQDGDPRRLEGPLYVALEPGGNHAALGFALEDPRLGRTEHPRTPYVILAPRADRLSKTLIHEGGHVAQRLALRTRPDEKGGWTPFPHTTFAVTDRRTALAEGYATHFETLWGHYGVDPGARAYYDHDAPAFGPEAGFEAEAYFPIRDLLTFSQGWARYAAVRDGLPAFRGHVVPDNYLRSQLSPMRDLGALKNAGQMLASEGVVAGFCFRWVAQRAGELGAKPRAGLDQPGLLRAEAELLQALRVAHDREGTAATVLDVVRGLEDAQARAKAVRIWVDLTRGVTADPALAPRWKALHGAAEAMDVAKVREAAKAMEQARAAIVAAAIADPAALAKAVGPVLPVRAARKAIRLKGLGETFPLEFDLNAAGEAEWAAVPGVPAKIRDHVLKAAAKGPFGGYADFRARTGIDLARLGLAPVKRPKPAVIL